MEMKSSSRPSFDRSREPGLKKPRLSDPFQQQLPPSSQQQRSVNSEMTRVSSSSRFRSSERDGGSDDTGRGPYQQQPQYMQQQQHEELISQYKIALGELTFNSKPIITNLTIIAGENLHAAKFIAAAICTNILEVPSEQKLPSLYLLDSIVKNIGKDYIKYFAARLPEVFCKAYSQVDPSIHPGMRHLFGTWKGVFPPQQLQIIEQELGFASAVNGLSGSATSRADSQFQRQPQAIHVNPKYLGLEARQRLQQSSRPKVTGTDISGTVIDSTEDLMKPDRTISIGAAKPWADPTMKLHNIQRPQREIARESIQQKQGAVGYGDYEYDAVLSKPLSAGMKRPSMSAVGQGYNKRWLGPGREVEESISSQRNGYDVRHGNSGYASNRSENMCMPFTENARSGGDISKSWKNSEEEEYMWDDLSTDVSDRGAVDSMRKDRWTPDDPEKLESGTHISKWRSQPEVGSRNDRETSIDPLSADLKEQTPLGHMGFSLRQMQEPRQLDRLSSSTPETGSRSMMGPTHQRPPSPSFSLRDPRQRDLPQRQVPPLPRSNHKTPPLQGQLNKGSQDKPLQDSMRVRPSNLPSGNLQKMQPQSVQKPGPLPQHVGPDKAEPSGQPQKALQLLGSLPTDLSLERPAADTPAHSNVSSLLAAVIKTGVISTSSAPGKVGTLPSFPTGSSSSHSTLSTWKRSTTAVVPSRDLVPTSPPKNLEKPPLASGFPPSSSPVASAGSVAFSSLLSTLVSSGLISAPKTESTAPEAPPDPRQNKTATSSTTKAPPIDKPSSSEPASINSDTSSQDMKLDIEDLVGYEFKPPILRKFHPAVVDKLFDQLPHSCSQCGFRFKLQESLDKHLEWHAFKNSQANNTNKPSRRWYSSSVSWFAGKALFPYEYRFSGDLLELIETGEENLQMVPADESQCVCILCGELFEDFYSQERDEWMFKDAVYMTVSPRSCESESCSKSRTLSLILHSKCMSNDAARELGLVHDIKEEGEDA